MITLHSHYRKKVDDGSMIFGVNQDSCMEEQGVSNILDLKCCDAKIDGALYKIVSYEFGTDEPFLITAIPLDDSACSTSPTTP